MTAKARLGALPILTCCPSISPWENIFGENGFHLVRGTPAQLAP